MRDVLGRKIPWGSTECARQVAALPYRLSLAPEVLLITSRETRRWVIPKGWPMKDRAPHEAAAQEALEEAGVVGTTTEDSIGVYRYTKLVKNGASILCEVAVYPLEVAQQLDAWPEQDQRNQQWFAAEEAAGAVEEAELGELIRAFAGRLASGSSS
ncbi:MAG: NUDIX hydrolase [Caulobacteraceae bacterium]